MKIYEVLVEGWYFGSLRQVGDLVECLPRQAEPYCEPQGHALKLVDG